MTKSFFQSDVNILIEKERKIEEALQYADKIINEYIQHHRNPELYNQRFLRKL